MSLFKNKIHITNPPCFLRKFSGKGSGYISHSFEMNNISLTEYKNIVLDDLLQLLNSSSSIREHEIDSHFSEVRKSVINYGIYSFAGMDKSRSTISRISSEIRKSIIKYEPRIVQNSLEVSYIEKNYSGSNLQFNIVAELTGLDKNNFNDMDITISMNIETGSCELV